MSGSGKGLIGLWLYRRGDELWTLKEDEETRLAKNNRKHQIEKKTEVKNDTAHSVIFSLKNQIGGLATALKTFQDKNINVIHIESRKSMRRDSEIEIYVDVQCENARMGHLIESLKKEVACIKLVDYDQGEELPPPTPITDCQFDFDCMPWFPKKLSDFDISANRVLMYGTELDADHPVI